MNISAVNATNNQPNFKGYVDPKLINLIKNSANGAIKNEAKFGISSGMLKGRVLQKIQKTSEKADEFIGILESSGVKELHPNTYLTYTYNEAKQTPYSEKDLKLILANDKLNQNTEFGTLLNCSSCLHTDKYNTKGYKFDPAKLVNDELAKVFDHISQFFEKSKDILTPEMLKKRELEMFTAYTDGGIIRSRRHKKANKLAPEFGLPSNWTEVLKEKRAKEELKKNLAIRLRNEKMQQEEQQRKQIEARNWEIVKKYLK